MRGPLPLDENDFAAVRAQVMAKIGRRQPTYAFEWGLAFAALVLCVLSFVVARQPMPSPGAARHPLPLTRARVEVVTPLPRAGEGAAKRQLRVAHHRKPHPKPIAVARIEIQTADPNIRIIWLGN
jgi:hypothetical protein